MDEVYTPNAFINGECPEDWEKPHLQPLVNYQAALLDSTDGHYVLTPQSHQFSPVMPPNISMINTFVDRLPPLQLPSLHDFDYNLSLTQTEEVGRYEEVEELPEPEEEKSPNKPGKKKKASSSDRRRKETLYQDEFIDTKKLCEQIAYELKSRCIPQTLFAEKIIGRSQGTLSDLLKNPKPWDMLKSGRETYKRMKRWLELPLTQRMAVFGMGSEADSEVPPIAFPLAVESAKKKTKRKMSEDTGYSPKRPRLVFTELQKRTLDAIFDETRNPSREMQEIIAARLQLEFATVQNYFMNMRRRSKLVEN